MARTALTAQNIVRAGITPTYAAANVDGHSFQNDAKTVLHVKTVGTACTLTFPTPVTEDSLAVADHTIVIGTNSERVIAGLNPNTFNVQSGADINLAYVDFSDVTAVTIALFHLP